MVSLFLLIRNFTTDTYTIFWKNPSLTYTDLSNAYSQEHQGDNFSILGGGKLSMDLDKKTVVFFGKSEFGHFNNELVNKLARDKFVHWTVITNPWEDKLDKAIAGWNKCDFQFQLYQGAYAKAVYALVIKHLEDYEVIPKTYPTQGKFMVLDGNDVLNIGKFVDPNDIHEIKRISHKRSS